MNKRQLDNLSPELEDHLKYAIIIDAGSSGTRIQIYSWIDTNFLKEKIKNTEKNEYLKYITDDGLPVIGQGSSSDNFDYQLKIEGGISSYENKVKDIDEHIKYIMDYAESVIPKNKYEETEVYLFATAGMRLLSLEKQEEILNEIYGYMKDNYKFKIKDKETNIRVITGEEEGLFGWISTNYLEHGFSVDEETNERETYNFVDMGGASTQIAFELDRKVKINGQSVNALENAKANKSDKNIIALNINNLYGDTLNFNIFVITFLQYGVNETRRRYLEAFLDKKRKDKEYKKLLEEKKINTNKLFKREPKAKAETETESETEIISETLTKYKDIVETDKDPNDEDDINEEENEQEKQPSESKTDQSNNTNTDSSNKEMEKTPEEEKGKIIWEDPCLPVNGRQDLIGPLNYVAMYGEEEGSFMEENIIIKGVGKYDECVKDVFPLLNSTIQCTSDSCLFNNIYSPYTAFDDDKFVAIGKYWDVVNVYHQAGLYDYDNFLKSSREFCQTEWSVHLNDYNEGKYPDLRKPYDLALNCFRSAYIENIIHKGYKIPKEDNEAIPFTTIAYINGTEASWALGALIKQISGTISEFDPNSSSSTAASISSNFISTSYSLSASALALIAVAGIALYRQRKNMPHEAQPEEVPLNEIYTQDPNSSIDNMETYINNDGIYNENETISTNSHFEEEMNDIEGILGDVIEDNNENQLLSIN